ncbi:hypothetical protein BD779DRAFT_1480573 [Infundibulicybe gibba]|nr:hypothetical protein BD779DRAFT_1481857 [Infundibulicybe gibba]KAF8868947.1 hypothetical protein BD779DRAFT_1480573 [Infundibulicybe gibba]
MARNKITDLPPPIRTRASNKIVHPGIPDQKKTRRNPVEVKRLREEDRKTKKAEEKRLTQAIKNVAAIEDQQRREDLERDAVANHPPVPDDIVEMGLEKAQHGIINGADSEEQLDHDFQDHVLETTGQQTEENPNEDEDSSGYRSSDDEDGDDEERTAKPPTVSTKRGNLAGHPSRAMIVSARATTTATGTPTRLLPSESNLTKRKGNTENYAPGVRAPAKKIKPSESIPTGISADWTKKNSHRTHMPSGASNMKGLGRNTVERSTHLDDDQMSRYGGLAGDDEYDDLDNPPAVGPQSGRRHTAYTKYESLVQITPRHRPPTQKQVRDGAKKWTLTHLPANTSYLFTSALTPLAREAAGCLEPWATLSVDDVQSLVDRVFKVGTFSVVKGEVWYGLLNYRINNWRNGFATAACEAVQALINDNPEALGTPDDIAYYVKWALKIEGQTAPFHWKNWGEGKCKKGLFQTPLIIRTFAEAHFAGLEDLTDPIDDKPVGALLLSVQAVERALGFWSTGAFVADTSTGSHFSADNWGDTMERRKAEGSSSSAIKTGTYKVRRATKYLASVNNFSAEHWENIFQEARELLAERQRKKKRTSSTASSAPDIIEDDTSDVILVSDSGEESLDDLYE